MSDTTERLEEIVAKHAHKCSAPYVGPHDDNTSDGRSFKFDAGGGNIALLVISGMEIVVNSDDLDRLVEAKIMNLNNTLYARKQNA